MDETSPENTVWLSPLVPDAKFKIAFLDDHVRVKLGDGFRIEPEQGAVFWNRVRRMCEEHGTSRVLVEGYLPAGERDTSDVVDAGKRTKTIPRLWMAFCFKDFEPTGQSEMYSAIAASHGVRVKFFDNTDRALTWLKNNSSK